METNLIINPFQDQQDERNELNVSIMEANSANISYQSTQETGIVFQLMENEVKMKVGILRGVIGNIEDKWETIESLPETFGSALELSLNIGNLIVPEKFIFYGSKEEARDYFKEIGYQVEKLGEYIWNNKELLTSQIKDKLVDMSINGALQEAYGYIIGSIATDIVIDCMILQGTTKIVKGVK